MNANQQTNLAVSGRADASPRRARLWALGERLARGSVGWAIIIAVWQGLTALGVISSFLFPSPLELADATIELLLDGSLLRHVGASIERVLVGFVIAVAVGIPLGVLLGWSKVVSDILRPVIEALRPIPPIAWTPIAIL